MNKKKLTIFIIVLWIFITAVCVIRNEITLKFGREVLLKTVPVDPRDLLAGDYVILNYEIGQLSSKGFKNNETVYVHLRTDNKNIAHQTVVSKNKPENELFIKGRVTGCNTILPFFKSSSKCIEYGIESYYVKEKTGMELERKLAQGGLVKVAITPDGKAKVKGFVERK